MSQFYKPDFETELDSPFIRDENERLIRRSYWLDMSDRTMLAALTRGIGSNLSNEEKRAHLNDIGRPHLIDEICIQEILPPK